MKAMSALLETLVLDQDVTTAVIKRLLVEGDAMGADIEQLIVQRNAVEGNIGRVLPLWDAIYTEIKTLEAERDARTKRFGEQERGIVQKCKARLGM